MEVGTVLKRLSLPLGSSILEPHLYLCLGKLEVGRQLLSLGAYNVVVLFERRLEAKKLKWREGGAYPARSSAWCLLACFLCWSTALSWRRMDLI